MVSSLGIDDVWDLAGSIPFVFLHKHDKQSYFCALSSLGVVLPSFFVSNNVFLLQKS